tara:strand:- start:224 stop:520 length:297 start_codon:yes stop_codon:yes gene_type:complete
MYRPLPDFLTIKESKIHGLGLYALSNIKKNYILGITHIKDSRFENGYIRTPLGGFFNHSENPNCKVESIGDYLLLISLTEISSGSEITAKYTLYNPSV